MSEPTPKRPNSPGPPSAQQSERDDERLRTAGHGRETGPNKAQQSKKGEERSPTSPPGRPIPVAKRLEANDETPGAKSSLVISRCYRVRELPPPPIIGPPRPDLAKAADERPQGAHPQDAGPQDILPDGLVAPPEPPMELDALQIRPVGRWRFCAAAPTPRRGGSDGWPIPNGKTTWGRP